jgi:hypothetical protein
MGSAAWVWDRRHVRERGGERLTAHQGGHVRPVPPSTGATSLHLTASEFEPVASGAFQPLVVPVGAIASSTSTGRPAEKLLVPLTSWPAP